MNATRALHARKMHGAGNTFVLLDERPPRFERYAALARTLCAQAGEFGGADGLLVVADARDAVAGMRVYNADGSEAEMCGNGVRCVARYLSEGGAGDAFVIATAAGPIATTIARAPAFAASVDVGAVTFPFDAQPRTLHALGRAWTFYDVAVPNPHAVTFVDDAAAVPLVELGAAFTAARRVFPHGTNLHVVQVLDGTTLRVRHFERGVGITQACGTGAVASAASAIVRGAVTAPVTVHVPGGTLYVAWAPGESARLTGPAETLFERTLAI